MRALVLAITCIALSAALVGCQYVDASRLSNATPTPEGPAWAGTEWAERGRLTVLIAGSDEAPDREGIRTDAMIVSTLDLDTGQVTLFGVPRNFGDIPLPDDLAALMGTETYTGMLKWLYGDAQEYPELADNGRDPGMVALKGAIGELLGLKIDHYAMVDMAGFIELVDAFGGVEIDIQAPIIVRLLSPDEEEGWVQFEIPAGAQTLNGPEALAYSRHRTGTTDYDRMQRQRCMVQALAEQADVQTIVLRFPELTDVIRNNIVTDVPLEMLPDLITLRETADMQRIVSIGFSPPEYHVGLTSEGHNLPNYEAILETVQDALENPDSYIDENEQENGTILEPRHC
jgi:polyisoprenyl-teichoic acid--peptidoglycan teichoic acid transferase